MREVPQYRMGAIVGYNAHPPVRGRGSCIFLHIWAGPGSHTAGCTALDETRLREVLVWLDAAKHPFLVQLTGEEYARRRDRWGLPAMLGVLDGHAALVPPSIFATRLAWSQRTRSSAWLLSSQPFGIGVRRRFSSRDSKVSQPLP